MTQTHISFERGFRKLKTPGFCFTGFLIMIDIPSDMNGLLKSMTRSLSEVIVIDAIAISASWKWKLKWDRVLFSGSVIAKGRNAKRFCGCIDSYQLQLSGDTYLLHFNFNHFDLIIGVNELVKWIKIWIEHLEGLFNCYQENKLYIIEGIVTMNRWKTQSKHIHTNVVYIHKYRKHCLKKVCSKAKGNYVFQTWSLNLKLFNHLTNTRINIVFICYG